jgi:hypothetical protein
VYIRCFSFIVVSVVQAIYFPFTLFKKYRKILICNYLRHEFPFTCFNQTRTRTVSLHGHFYTKVYTNRSTNMESTGLILSTLLNTVRATACLFSRDPCLPDNFWWRTAVLKSLKFDIDHKLIHTLLTKLIYELWWYRYKLPDTHTHTHTHSYMCTQHYSFPYVETSWNVMAHAKKQIPSFEETDESI